MKRIITGLLFSLISIASWSDTYWTLFVVATGKSKTTDSRYVALASFSDRASCEKSIKTNNYFIAETLETKILIRCLRTDEPAGGQ